MKTKICTDVEQSNKLIELGINIATADMFWANDILIATSYITNNDNETLIPAYKDAIPAWSLAALSEFILPYVADDDGNNYKFYLSKDGLDRWIAYYKNDDVSIHICEESDNMIDVILEMVCWLKEQEMIEG